MKKLIIKRKLMKLFLNNPNQFFDRYDVSDTAYTSWFGNILYYHWSDIENCLKELINKGKVTVITDILGMTRYGLSRRYHHDRFLYKG